MFMNIASQSLQPWHPLRQRRRWPPYFFRLVAVKKVLMQLPLLFNESSNTLLETAYSPERREQMALVHFMIL